MVESNMRNSVLNEQAGEPNGKVLDQAPPWIAEEVGHDMARKLGEKMKELSIDEHLLPFFDHDSWGMVGVENPVLRFACMRVMTVVLLNLRDRWEKRMRASLRSSAKSARSKTFNRSLQA
jgi:hypothetical protein